MTLQEHFDYCKLPSPYTVDILEHIDTLKEYASKCDHVTEMGFRTGTSFTAFLMGQPKKLISYDILLPNKIEDFFNQIRGNTEIKIIEGNTLEIEIEDTDLLFIDTLHTYVQLKLELKRHGHKAKKYMIFHDTTTFRNKGEDGRNLGLWDAIIEYLNDHPEWQIEKEFTNNNGLTILSRK